MSYSPANAIPMQEYSIIKPPSLEGFQVQHSDYQKLTFFGTNVTTSTVTKRTFIPPCTTVFQGPFLSGILYFCPSKPGETNTIAHFALSRPKTDPGKLSLKQRIVAFVNKKTPASYMSYVADWIHFMQWTSDPIWRFASQDRVIMQGQDLRKLLSANPQSQQNNWDDLVPTTSDVGVSVFQKWMRRYGRGGPFSLSEMSQALAIASNNNSNDNNAGVSLSIWEKHGKYCEICQRVMKRLASLEIKAKKWSICSFCASAIAALYAASAAAMSSSFWRIVTKRTLTTASSSAAAAVLPLHVVAALSWSMLALVLSMACQRVAVASNQLQHRVLNTPSIPSIKMMDIYQDV
jgi:hypothetical protein